MPIDENDHKNQQEERFKVCRRLVEKNVNEPIAQDKQNLPGMQQRPSQTSKIESMATIVYH